MFLLFLKTFPGRDSMPQPHNEEQVIEDHGWTYHGEVKSGRRHGYGVYVGTGKWNKGYLYEGEFRDGGRHGKGLLWLGKNRCFEGNWTQGLAHQGTAVEPNRTCFFVTFSPSAAFYDEDGWRQAMASAKRVPCGRLECWPPAPGGPGGCGGCAEWTGVAVRADGSRFEGTIRWLCPIRGTVRSAAGEVLEVTYCGSRTFGEEPLCVEARRPAIQIEILLAHVLCCRPLH